MCALMIVHTLTLKNSPPCRPVQCSCTVLHSQGRCKPMRFDVSSDSCIIDQVMHWETANGA